MGEPLLGIKTGLAGWSYRRSCNHKRRSWEAVEIFRPEELPLVVGVADLQRAINKKDEAGFWLANEKVRPWQRQRNMPGVTITYKAIGRDWGAAQSLYADLMNELTQNVRLILWQPERGQLRPALYCPDLKTAKFVLLLMGRIRVCPKCKEIFRPKNARRQCGFLLSRPRRCLAHGTLSCEKTSTIARSKGEEGIKKRARNPLR